MKNSNNDFHLLESLSKKNTRRRLLRRGMALLSALVLLLTVNALKRMAVALEHIPTCGYEYEHTHTEECYDEDGALICDLHEHTDACYQETPDGEEEAPEVFEEQEVDLEDVLADDADAQTGESADTQDGDEAAAEGDEGAVEDETADVEETVEDNGYTYNMAGEQQALLSEVLAATKLPVTREAIQMVGLVDDGSTSEEPIVIALTDQDVAITALQSFEAVEIAIVTADDIFTV